MNLMTQDTSNLPSIKLNKLLSVNLFMEKFIADTLKPLLTQGPFSEQQAIDKATFLEAELKILTNLTVKAETASLNKQLAKKTRELFIASSDIETFKESINDLQDSINSAKHQYSSLEQEKTKQRLQMERQMAETNKENEKVVGQLKKDCLRLKQEKDLMQDEHKDKVRQLKKESQKELNEAIEAEKRLQQEQETNMMREFEESKNHIIKDSNDKKREIIRKYEEKIVKLSGEYEDKLYLINKQFDEFKKQTKQNKVLLQNKISVLENSEAQLTANLSKETQAHTKFEDLFRQADQELSMHQEKALKEKEKVEQELHEMKKKLYQEERKYITDMKNLNKVLQDTIESKDKKFRETVMTMETESKIAYESMETQLIEEREMAVNDVQIQRDKENYDHETRYQRLQEEFGVVKERLVTITEEYEKKIKDIEKQHQNYVQGINMRKQYELQVNEKNSDREFKSLQNKYELQIKAIHRQHEKEVEDLGKKSIEEKLALSNKLTTQYQSMINDQKSSAEIQIKQKLIEFERKAKGYEAKLKDADKKRNEIKVASERAKMEMQMRVDSMVELNEVFENQIASLNEKMQDIERSKEKIINEYEFKILQITNEMKRTIQEFQAREEDMKELLESKLKAKNKEMSIMLSKVKRETDELVDRHEKRVNALEKEYNELKRVLGQKTSLPEDIEALKIFHAAYIEKEEELEKERKKIESLRRELMAKDAIDKVFAQKGYKKIAPGSQTLTNFASQYSSANVKLMTFKSQQL